MLKNLYTKVRLHIKITVSRMVSLTGRTTIAKNVTDIFDLNHGSDSFNTAESNAQRQIKAGTFKNGAVNVSANSITAASTVTSRKNAAVGTY